MKSRQRCLCHRGSIRRSLCGLPRGASGDFRGAVSIVAVVGANVQPVLAIVGYEVVAAPVVLFSFSLLGNEMFFTTATRYPPLQSAGCTHPMDRTHPNRFVPRAGVHSVPTLCTTRLQLFSSAYLPACHRRAPQRQPVNSRSIQGLEHLRSMRPRRAAALDDRHEYVRR